MLSRFHMVPERNGQTDERTDRFAISISRVSMLTRDKNPLNASRRVYRASGWSPKDSMMELEVGIG